MWLVVDSLFFCLFDDASSFPGISCTWNTPSTVEVRYGNVEAETSVSSDVWWNVKRTIIRAVFIYLLQITTGLNQYERWRVVVQINRLCFKFTIFVNE